MVFDLLDELLPPASMLLELTAASYRADGSTGKGLLQGVDDGGYPLADQFSFPMS